MAETTGIEWCDATVNFWVGCTPVSDGCTNCYAAREMKRYGQDPRQLRRTSKRTFNLLLAKNRDGSWKIPPGSRVCVCSWSDFFHEDVPGEWRKEAECVMASRHDLTYLLLTKRVTQMAAWAKGHPFLCPGPGSPRLPDFWDRNPYSLPSEIRQNVWLGVTAENQAMWNKRVRELMRIDWPGKRFVSCEPLLGEIDADFCDAGQAIGPCGECGHTGSNPECEACDGLASIDWIICGGESGPNNREIKLDWARGLRDQCVEADVPYFLKQMRMNGKLVKMPELDGKVWDERPGRV